MWIRKPTPVIIKSITIVTWSIRKAKGIFKSPELNQLNKCIVAGWSPREKKVPAEIIKEAKIIRDEKIPAEVFLNIFFPNPRMMNPKSGNTGINQVKFSIIKNRAAKVKLIVQLTNHKPY